ncbi:MAG: CoA transferase [Dehalococcoidia bacterium]
MTRLPLEHVRVVDMTAVIGAPYGTLLLADLGAEVIRVESRTYFPSTTRGYQARPQREIIPNLGPVGRGYPDYDPGPRPWNRFALFNGHAVNKLSMTADILRPEGRKTVEDLVRISDLVIENMTGALDKLGLGYERLRQVKPDIIMVSVSGMGATGPYRNLRGYGQIFEDVLGHAWLRGYPDDHPQSVTQAVASDPAAGAGLVWASMAALHYRDVTGRGQYIDMSMAENYIHHLGSTFLDYAMNGRVQRTTGNRHPFLSPHGCYRCQGEDRWVTIVVSSDEEWRALRQAMGDPVWARDRRFADGYCRRRNQDELDRRIEAWTRRQTAQEVQERLQQAGVAAGAVLDIAQCFHDRHLRQRGFFQRIDHPDAGVHDYPVGLWQMSESRFEVRQPPPLLGEHNEHVYRELLAFREEDYRRLEAAGHIGMDYASEIP